MLRHGGMSEMVQHLPPPPSTELTMFAEDLPLQLHAQVATAGQAFSFGFDDDDDDDHVDDDSSSTDSFDVQDEINRQLLKLEQMKRLNHNSYSTNNHNGSSSNTNQTISTSTSTKRHR
ncbi:hypothetical protein PTSG_12351 [Salpingoeca rosetta]|uniref:Uncharacterized protein n=1 Tax=Salpingoeca rosetta (strain ATCC 50818 / BSB-021) TaxID=946362 RepID=F2UB16_SALR5|nr:uncharacterized protein PTSG_12351 [Salpingoeca rosetta]EGD74029.1 hypothetical protein PTSG_12351 [Salpingoeca rosetta]|eukprot:XP_004993591.1 hypothetical protein PTSG_12351 [Salpingoeca rosetta]